MTDPRLIEEQRLVLFNAAAVLREYAYQSGTADLLDDLADQIALGALHPVGSVVEI